MRALSSRLLMMSALSSAMFALASSEALAQRGGRAGFGGFQGGGVHGSGRGLVATRGHFAESASRPSRLGGIGFGPGYGPDFGFARPQRGWRGGLGGRDRGFAGGGREGGRGGFGGSGPIARPGIRPSPIAPPALYAVGRRGAPITADSSQAGASSGVVSSAPRIIRIGR